MTRRFLIGKNDRVVRTDTYLVRVELHDGRVIEDLEPRRLFPYTMPNEYITLLSANEKEQALIQSMNELDKASRCAVEECFDEYYLIPRISGILHIEDKAGSFKWAVMTERGRVDFRIRNRQSDIKESDGKMFIRDANDNRYYIDLSMLDQKSLKKIASYI